MAVVSLFSVLLLVCTLERGAGEFSSKTPYGYYRASEFKLSSEQIFEFSRFDLPDEVNQCEKLNLNVLYRHGTRNPSSTNFNRAVVLVNVTKDHASELSQTADGFDPRTLTQPTGSASQLKEIADDEFAYLAKYTNALFNNQSCAAVALEARSTSVKRTVDSGHILLNNMCHGSTVPNITTDDELLRFFETCQRYIEEVDENAAAVAEVTKFEATPQFLEILTSVAKAFNDSGFRFEAWLGRSLDRDDLQMIYEFCALDVAHNRSQLNTSTGWCALIRKHFQVFDYYMDMDYYYTGSNAYPINYQSACGVYDFLRESVNKNGNTDRVTLLFAHLETLLPVVTLLNFIDPAEQLTADNYATLGSSRKFRVERIAHFASNVALRTVRCGAEVRIYFMLNERVQQPRHCASQKYCTLQEFEDYYKTACPKPVSEICAPASSLTTVNPSDSTTNSGASRFSTPIGLFVFAFLLLFIASP